MVHENIAKTKEKRWGRGDCWGTEMDGNGMDESGDPNLNRSLFGETQSDPWKGATFGGTFFDFGWVWLSPDRFGCLVANGIGLGVGCMDFA